VYALAYAPYQFLPYQLPGAVPLVSWWQAQLDILQARLPRPRPPSARYLAGVVAKRGTLMAALLCASPLEAGDTLRDFANRGEINGVENGQDSVNLWAEGSVQGGQAKQSHGEDAHGGALPRGLLGLSADQAAAEVASLIVNLWVEGRVLVGDFISDALRFLTYHLRLWIDAVNDARDPRVPNPRGRSLLQRSSPEKPEPAIWIRHLSDAREVIRPISAICHGDVIVVEAGELIPLPGTVTDGVAWLRHCPEVTAPVTGRPGRWRASTGDPACHPEAPADHTTPDYRLVTVGHQVPASSIVEVGRLHIGVKFN
jgi:hypothetical protein